MKRYLIPYTSANSIWQVINYLSSYFPIRIKNWKQMNSAQQLMTLRNANTLGINKSGNPGIYLENSNIESLTKSENYGKKAIFLNQTSINRKWMNCRDLDGASYNGTKYTMKEIESIVGKRVYIKNLPNKDDKPLTYYLSKVFGLVRGKDTKFKYVYSVNQLKKQLGGEFRVTDPWNNIPPIQYSVS